MKNKKYSGKIYTIIVFLCSVIIVGTLIVSSNLKNIIDHFKENNVGFRTLIVMPKKDDIELISKIDNVVDVYEGVYRETAIKTSSLKNDVVDGGLILKRKNIDLGIVYGRNFKEDNEIICPINFYPDSNPTLINKKGIIDWKNALNKTIKVDYFDYVLDENNNRKENKLYSRELKIVGLYDSSKLASKNNVCYINSKSLKEIVDNKKIRETEVIDNEQVDIVNYSLDVVVDDIDNVSSVWENLEKMDYKVEYLVNSVNNNAVILFIITIATILVLTTIVLILATVFHINKMNKKDITKLIVKNLIIYLISNLIVLLILYVLKEYFPFVTGIDYIVGISLNIYPLVSLLLIVIVPYLTIKLLNEK